MRSLFTKIFLWFCIAQVFFAGAILVALRVTEPEFGWPLWRGIPVRDFEDRALEAMQAFEKGGREALKAALSKPLAEPQSQTWLLDASGRDLRGEYVPPIVAMCVRQKQEPGVEMLVLLNRILLAAEVRASDGRKHVFLTSTRRSMAAPFDSVSWLRLAVAMSAIAAVCWWLARYITRPVVEVQAASRRLAAGDFSARASTGKLAARHDELSDLARDFDFMAARIQALVLAERRLIADISHELGSPLTRVNVALGLARRKAGALLGPELDRINLETVRLNHLIQELLDLASLESEGPLREAVPVDLKALVEDVASDADFEASGSNRRVIFSRSDAVTVKGSPALLRRAIENILRNALRYTPEGTDVQVSLERNPATNTVTVRVRDQGPGVPESELEKIFAPFYRVSKSRDPESGGAGLGLAIARRAVECHGGTINARNRPDQGLEVSAEVPL